MAQGSIRGAGTFSGGAGLKKLPLSGAACSERPALSLRLDPMTHWRFNAAESQRVDVTGPAKMRWWTSAAHLEVRWRGEPRESTGLFSVSAQLRDHRRRRVGRCDVAPARAHIIREVGDLLIGELSGERRHCNVAVARRNPLKHDLDDVCRVRRNDDAVARKRREDADNAPAPGLLAAAAMVGVERTAALLRRV